MNTWQTIFRSWLLTPLPKALEPQHLLLDHAAIPLAVAKVLATHSGRVAIITPDSRSMETLGNALATFQGITQDARELIQVPAVSYGQRRQWIPENEAARCAALDAALSGNPHIFIASAASLLSRAIPPKSFAEQTLTIRLDDATLPPDELARRLVGMDYDNEFEVCAPGEFARRGGILDLYCPLYENPVRIEYFGDSIDSMRFFNPETQRSLTAVEEIRVIPRGEMAAAPSDETTTCFQDYLTEDTLFLLCNPEEIREHLEQFAGSEETEAFEALCQSDARQCELVLATSNTDADALPIRGLHEFLTTLPGDLGDSAAAWHWNLLREQLSAWTDDGYTLVACCGSEGESNRFRELCEEHGDLSHIPIAVEPLSLEAGLLLPEAKLVLLSERELFGRPAIFSRKRRYNFDIGKREEASLEEGTYVVHASHGLCLYHGIREIGVGGELQEVIELEFADDAKLYVPLAQAHLVSSYIGGTRKVPHLSKLGGVAWKNAKAAAASSAMDLAAELLRFDAIRQQAQGCAFPKADWETSFANAFPYVETDDQKKAIAEILEDMASAQPMDRLLCGDVGYGKTEVAIRAAFRTVMNGKQVAILVPTTILAQQHYLTFRERMADYPVVIEMLSRFRTKGTQKQTIEDIGEGKIDIIIGTHRLLQKDVKFSDLGLVVIDEEQRFGVMHKEKFKRLRATVDILTMTATPIPRTLYFSLSGLRRLSTIMTPPSERLPVTTIVASYDKELIRQAILREVERRGQVFFLHNRVGTIDQTCRNLQELVPEAKFIVGHGQMAPAQLERVMLRFLEQKADVLVCTTIIESGLDLQNANTIIIDRADRFGLAELYQLRGRVGRHHHQAYAYLLLPPMGQLPRNARERLAAIRRYTHLGAGFKLALRDLEIRGAGNILGTEQSGAIAAVGFELYCELLREAVHRLEPGDKKQAPAPPAQQTQLHLEEILAQLQDEGQRLPCAFNPDYIGAESVRIECHRRLNQMKTTAEIQTFREELQDRFGPLPQATQNLLEIETIRILADLAHFHLVTVRNGRVFLEGPRGLHRDRQNKTPLLTASQPLDQLRELQQLLRKLG
jgi:transcription-repair coupling factor (superfamily II helicase)